MRVRHPAPDERRGYQSSAMPLFACGDGHCVNVLSCLIHWQVLVAPGFTQRLIGIHQRSTHLVVFLASFTFTRITRRQPLVTGYSAPCFQLSRHYHQCWFACDWGILWQFFHLSAGKIDHKAIVPSGWRIRFDCFTSPVEHAFVAPMRYLAHAVCLHHG